MNYHLVLSCEHAENKIPKRFSHAYIDFQQQLATHAGYDIGAKSIFKEFKKLQPAYAQAAQYSRLLIDLNRTLNYPHVFSKISNQFINSEKSFIIKNYYLPYLNKLKQTFLAAQSNKVVIHISIHSFTPNFNGETRHNAVGFLYDPKRSLEKEFCKHWRDNFLACSDFSVRMNYPYRGTSNGLTTHFRKQFNQDRYIGIELEVNQKFLLTVSSQELIKMLRESCADVLRDF